MKNIVSRVDPAGPLRGAVEPGDELLSINGRPIRDVLDYKYYSYESRLLLELRRPDGRIRLIRLRKGEGRDPGLEFETYLMDRARSCANRCLFCFIDQNPPGMRKTVYFKDDDARLSFLMGCYITLTNLSEREIRRIIDLRVSPVNISVHATDGALRQKLLGNPRAGEVMERMESFAAAGIRMNCQIVCCPGLNDGEALDRTLRDLGSLWPAVHSVSVVPVGLTKHREGLCPLRPFTRAEAADALRRTEAFGARFLREHGTRLAFCADELYQLAGLELPPDEYYEEHTQLENGVGMLRLLESEFLLALKLADASDAESAVPFSIATGYAAAPMLESLLGRARARFPVLEGRLYAIRNDFFGETVTVAGLITGGDLIAQLRGRELGARLLVSETMLRRAERDFLDSVTLAEAERALGVPIVPVPEDGAALLDAMLGRLPVPPLPAPGPEGTGYNRYH